MQPLAEVQVCQDEGLIVELFTSICLWLQVAVFNSESDSYVFDKLEPYS